MVEINVALADPMHAHGLMRRLAGLFDGSSVSWDRAHNEIRIRSEWESRSVLKVIDAVESWLASAGVDSAELSIGERSYTMAGPVVATDPGGLAA